MHAPSVAIILVRALARSDWDTVDLMLARLRHTGWAGATQVIGVAFTFLVHRRFESVRDLHKISRFVAETRQRYGIGKELPTLELEGLVRAVLGEIELMDSINPEVAVSGQILLLGQLLQDEKFSHYELEEFLGEVATVAGEYLGRNY